MPRKDNFPYLQDYMSAKGITLIKVGRAKYELRSGERVTRFTSLLAVSKHIKAFY